MRPIRHALLLGSVAALAACSDTSPNAADPSGPAEQRQAPVISAAPGRGVDGRYLVIMRPGTQLRTLAQADIAPRHVYEAAVSGFAADLTPAQVERLRRNPDVEYIEQDQVFEYAATQSPATWGIDRIDQRNRPLSNSYTYTNTASTVRAYIIDSGINPNHTNFGGRAVVSYDATGGTGIDCNGHGTHTAGTVGSATYGVAKAVLIRAVRVGTCGSSLFTSDIVEGVDWVRVNHVKPAVANMSLGGGISSTIDNAVSNLINAGVFVSVAAGNSNINACNSSPARVAAATTVAASTSTDAKASYSNYGSCVDLYAPGSSVVSTWYSSNTATASLSGTSMAAPHVTGVAALYKGTFGDASQSTINAWIVNNATTNVITGNPSGTPNRLLFKSTL